MPRTDQAVAVMSDNCGGSSGPVSMKYIYFTKMLRGLELPAMAEFLRSAGLDGADLAVRPGYPVHPGNVGKELAAAVKRFKEQELSIPLVSAVTNLTDPASAEAVQLFDAAGQAGVSAIKIGYFLYSGNYRTDLELARKRLAGFARLAEKTGVKACYHTHSGNYIGSNCAGMKMLLADLDPHHVGAFVDTGHQTIGGEPFRMALDMVADWFSLLAIKDMIWHKTDRGWRSEVVPAGEGIADWNEIRAALQARRFDGLVSLHAEFETTGINERLELARKELAFLKGTFHSD
jgi:sugar phosphate isomerase/epimerase